MKNKIVDALKHTFLLSIEVTAQPFRSSPAMLAVSSK